MLSKIGLAIAITLSTFTSQDFTFDTEYTPFKNINVGDFKISIPRNAELTSIYQSDIQGETVPLPNFKKASGESCISYIGELKIADGSYAIKTFCGQAIESCDQSVFGIEYCESMPEGLYGLEEETKNGIRYGRPITDPTKGPSITF